MEQQKMAESVSQAVSKTVMALQRVKLFYKEELEAASSCDMEAVERLSARRMENDALVDELASKVEWIKEQLRAVNSAGMCISRFKADIRNMERELEAILELAQKSYEKMRGFKEGLVEDLRGFNRLRSAQEHYSEFADSQGALLDREG